MLTYDLTKRKKLPIYDYLYRCIKADILSKKLKPDEKLPSKRQLASHHKISVITVENAYAQLLLEGYIYSVEKRGYFVSLLADITPLPEKKSPAIVFDFQEKEEYLLDISSGKIKSENFPFSVWSKLTRQTLAESYTGLLKAVPHNGLPELRQAICDYLYHFRGMTVSSNQVIIGAGTEYLYTLLTQLMQGGHFAVENPGYKKVSKIFAACGAKWSYIDLDDSGINTACLNGTEANIIHTSPAHHYPTGIVMSAAKRRELLNWAYSSDNRYIIEDDYDSEFRFTGKPLPPLVSLDGGERVIYMNTFSKTIAPSMRISYMILPKILLREYNQKLGFYSCTVPSLEQYTLYKFIDGGYFEKHISRMKNSYKSLRDRVIKIITESKLSKKITITEKDAGLHFLIRANGNTCENELKEKLLSCGIKASFLSEYSYNEDKKFANTIVFNYSGIDTESLKEAIHILEKVFSLK